MLSEQGYKSVLLDYGGRRFCQSLVSIADLRLVPTVCRAYSDGGAGHLSGNAHSLFAIALPVSSDQRIHRAW